MSTVSINPPKTAVTAGSNGVAAASTPNVCKMPGPPAPFVPTPLPNVGKSGSSPKGFSKRVKIEGHAVAIRGASFGSVGDLASKGTGGGIVSMNAEGPARFIGPGSFDVSIEGKSVHLLGDSMSNNNGASGSPPNAATLTGILQAPAAAGFGSSEQELQQLADQSEAEDGQRSDTAGTGCRGRATQTLARGNPASGGAPPRVKRPRRSIERDFIVDEVVTEVLIEPAIDWAARAKESRDVGSENPDQSPRRCNTEAAHERELQSPREKKPSPKS